MRNKKVLLLLLTLLLALALVGCGGQKEEVPQISGSITLIWPDGTAQSWQDVQVAEGATASQALTQVLQGEKMAYNYANGMWSGIGGVESGAEDGWLFYVDGELAPVGADDVVLTDGFSFSFEYTNYAAAFGW